MARSQRRGSVASASQARLRVGVTLFIRDEHQSIWENGIFQNAFFLLSLLQKAPAVEWCCLVAGGPGDPAKASDLLKHAGAEIIDMTEAMERLDVVIELSAQLDAQWGRAFVERGGRVIAMRVANDFVIDAERMAFGLPPGLVMSGIPYAEVWTLPAFSRTCAAYYAAGYRAPVRGCSTSGLRPCWSGPWQSARAERPSATCRAGNSGGSACSKPTSAR